MDWMHEKNVAKLYLSNSTVNVTLCALKFLTVMVAEAPHLIAVRIAKLWALLCMGNKFINFIIIN